MLKEKKHIILNKVIVSVRSFCSYFDLEEIPTHIIYVNICMLGYGHCTVCVCVCVCVCVLGGAYPVLIVSLHLIMCSVLPKLLVTWCFQIYGCHFF